MSLLTIILALVLVGVLLWALNAFVPMDATVKKILNVVVVLALVIWLLKAFGLFASVAAIHI